MNYIEREKLTIINVSDDMDAVSVDTLAGVMLDRPSNIIYCESGEKLYGIISMGDIARALERELDKISINRHYSHVCVGDHTKARKIFNENKNVNGLPAVDSAGICGGGVY